MIRTPLLALLLLSAAPLRAADPAPTVPQRVDRLEKELRAVQRKVFPGGGPAFLEPEIAAQPAAAPAGLPATAPINELTARVDGLERELARTTAQIEETQHRLAVLSEQAARDRNDFDSRLKALEAPPPAAAPLPAPRSDDPGRPGPSRGRPAKAAPPPPEAPPPPAPAPDATASSAGDPAEDAYMAGYKLWTDKRYGEAEAALDRMARQYPKHRRASYARNLLGRAQLDDGKPATAAQTFLANYQADPHGERAPDSLFYLGQSLTQLKKTDNACRAYDELQDVYGGTMSDTIKARLPAARKAAACK